MTFSTKPGTQPQEIGPSGRIYTINYRNFSYTSRGFLLSFYSRKRKLDPEFLLESKELIDCNKLRILVCVNLSGERPCHTTRQANNISSIDLKFCYLLQFW